MLRVRMYFISFRSTARDECLHKLYTVLNVSHMRRALAYGYSCMVRQLYRVRCLL